LRLFAGFGAALVIRNRRKNNRACRPDML